MRHIGVSGSRKGLSERQWTWIHTKIWGLRGEWTLHHGDCIGADEEIHRIFDEAGFPIMIHPPIDPTRRAWMRSAQMMPQATFQARNRDIVMASNVVWAFPDGPEDENPRSGTWMTVRIAKRLDVPIIVVFPSGVTEALL